MNRQSLFITFIAVLLLSSCRVQKINQGVHEFSQDLSDANIKLRGKLMLIGNYKDDLSTLTYENYLILLKKNERPSTVGVVETIQNSDSHLFVPKENTFLIVIYSRKLKAVIFDDASTALCDSIKSIDENEPVPDLTRFIKK